MRSAAGAAKPRVCQLTCARLKFLSNHCHDRLSFRLAQQHLAFHHCGFQALRLGHDISDRCRHTGLGLSIAKRIINLHGGRIWVSSEPGSGSTFFIDVPIKVEHQAGHA